MNTGSNYFIFRGKLNPNDLRKELGKLGLTNLYMASPSYIGVIVSIFHSGFQVISLLIFFLTFGALNLIGQIRSLRTAGIRLISGESRWKIFLNPLGNDVINALLGLVMGLGSATVLKSFLPFPFVSFYIIGIGLLIYNLFLLLISFFFACLFIVGIKKVHLMQVIKGQIPVRGIVSLVLLGQLFAIVIVSIGISRTLLYSQAWQQQKQGQEIWNREKDLTTLTLGRGGISPGIDEEAIKSNKLG